MKVMNMPAMIDMTSLQVVLLAGKPFRKFSAESDGQAAVAKTVNTLASQLTEARALIQDFASRTKDVDEDAFAIGRSKASSSASGIATPSVTSTTLSMCTPSSTCNSSYFHGNVTVQAHEGDAYPYTHTRELDLYMPHRIRCKISECYKRTEALCRFLVDEAEKCTALHGGYDYTPQEVNDGNGARNRIKINSVDGMLDLAQILVENQVEIDKTFLKEMDKMLRSRQKVTEWYRSQPFVKDSPFDYDNRKHGYFNQKLAETLDLLDLLSLKTS